MIAPNLEFRLRENQGRPLRERFVGGLEAALGRSADTIRWTDLSQRDELWSRFQDEWRARVDGHAPSFRRVWSAADRVEVEEVLNVLRNRIPNQTIFMFPLLNQYCGAVETSVHEILGHAFDLVSVDQHEVLSMCDDASCGFIFEHYTNPGPHDVYDLLVWGEKWLDVLAE